MSRSNTPEAIFAAAEAGLGAPDALSSLQTIVAVADCVGPNGPYTTEVISARDGRLRFTQTWPGRPVFRAYADAAGAWAEDAAGALHTLGAAGAAMVRSHEFQLLPLVLRERYAAPRLDPADESGPARRLALHALDPLGMPCRLFFDAESALWAGVELVDPRGPGPAAVLVEVLAWRRVGGVLLPAHVRATDAAGAFKLSFHTIAVNAAGAADLAPPAGATR